MKKLLTVQITILKQDFNQKIMRQLMYMDQLSQILDTVKKGQADKMGESLVTKSGNNLDLTLELDGAHDTEFEGIDVD